MLSLQEERKASSLSPDLNHSAMSSVKAFIPVFPLPFGRMQRPVHVCKPSAHCPRTPLYAAARGPTTPKPDYTHIDSNPFNAFLTSIFRKKLENELGSAASADGYPGVVEVVTALARQHRGDAMALRSASKRVLASLFPTWMPPAFTAVISRPAPLVSAWLNAIVTVVVTQWLMGPSRLSESGEPTVEIDRCRYLEGA